MKEQEKMQTYAFMKVTMYMLRGVQIRGCSDRMACIAC